MTDLALDRHLPAAMPAFGAAMRALFPIDPETTYVNHGGFGVAPRAMLAVQDGWRRRIEANPTRFLVREHLSPLVRAAADAVAARLGGRGEDWVFVINATDGANAVLRSLTFAAGDEIMVTDHGYNALKQCALHTAATTGAVVKTVTLPWPDADADGIVAAIAAGLTTRTSLVIIDHITSPTSMVLPVARIAARVREAGARLLVDGAHVPGHLPLDVPALGVDWYVGNLHKWAFVPRSAAVLWCRPELQPALHPTTISHGYTQGYTNEFDWQGTRDFSAILSTQAAFGFADRLGGLERIGAWNRQVLARFAERLHAELRTNESTPAALRGFAMTIALPQRLPATHEAALAVRQRLYEQCRLEAPVFPLAGRLWLRVAAQVYLAPDDLPEGIGAAVG